MTTNWVLEFFENDLIIKFFKLKQPPIQNIEWFYNLLSINEVKDKVIFDQCCGTGRVSKLFLENQAKVYGCDISPKAIKEALIINKNSVLADAHQYIPPELCDIALNLYSSFPYSSDDSQNELIIKQLYESLKPNGKVIIELMDADLIKSNFNPELIFENYTRKSTIIDNILYQDWFYNGKFIIKTSVKLYSQKELKILLSKYFTNITMNFDNQRLVFTGNKHGH
jgi:SAM-dependent methyltransferase